MEFLFLLPVQSKITTILKRSISLPTSYYTAARFQTHMFTAPHNTPIASQSPVYLPSVTLPPYFPFIPQSIQNHLFYRVNVCFVAWNVCSYSITTVAYILHCTLIIIYRHENNNNNKNNNKYHGVVHSTHIVQMRSKKYKCL